MTHLAVDVFTPKPKLGLCPDTSKPLTPESAPSPFSHRRRHSKSSVAGSAWSVHPGQPRPSQRQPHHRPQPASPRPKSERSRANRGNPYRGTGTGYSKSRGATWLRRKDRSGDAATIGGSEGRKVFTGSAGPNRTNQKGKQTPRALITFLSLFWGTNP